MSGFIACRADRQHGFNDNTHLVAVGDHQIVGAGSVVTKNIPPNIVAAGAPCRVIRPITEADAPASDRSRIGSGPDGDVRSFASAP